MRRLFLSLVVLFLTAAFAGACGSTTTTTTTDVDAMALPTVGDGTATAVPVATADAPVEFPTEKPAATATQAPAATATQPPVPTATQPPAPTATEAPAPTPTPAPTDTPAPTATEEPVATEEPIATEGPEATPTEEPVGNVAERRDVLLTFASAWDNGDWETVRSLSANPEVLEAAKDVYVEGGDASTSVGIACDIPTLSEVSDDGASECEFLYAPPEGHAWIFNVTIEDVEGTSKVTKLINGGDAG